MAEGTKDARQRAAEARAAALAKEKRRERSIRIIGGLVVLVVVGVIIGGSILVSGGGSSDTATPDENAALPTGISSSDFRYVVNPDVSGDVPTVLIYEDFQCPFCKKFEETSGVALLEQAREGKLKLQFQPGIFLDANLQNTGSQTATASWGCAIDAGKGIEFHEGVFAAQPAEETVGAPGFTKEQMIALGQSVGITGDATAPFEKCVNDGQYNGWAANSNAQFEISGVSTTPSIYVNGSALNTQGLDIFDPAVLIPAIEAAAK
ncbi:MAG: thioredoxin domain-containing protein [Actinobacteria bacterium]|nr:thioredoxin domain-containing protein [Actinomycetota bacterium]